jgi:predicted O-linked N-acetylglucosamine transferase (SPINDLY family)
MYEVVLAADERHFEALYRLGTIRLQRSQFEAAAGLFRRATKVNRKSADANHCLGFALTGLNRIDEAIRAYEKALAIRPAFPEAHNNLGHTLQIAGRHSEAIKCYEKALALDPDYVEARNNLGNTLHLQDRSGDAVKHYEMVLAIRPNYAEARWNLATSLRAIRRYEEAIAEYGKALAIKPSYLEAHVGLGTIFTVLGRFDEAISEFTKALVINPANVDVLIDLGNTFAACNQDDKAIAQYDMALAINPDSAAAFCMRGTALAKLKRLDEAMQDFEKALGIEPGSATAFNGLLNAALKACDWTRTDMLSANARAWIAQGKLVSPFMLLGFCNDPSLHLEAARIHARHEVRARTPALWNRTVWRNEKIRLAYVAAGFHHHPTAYLTAELLEIHDRSRFEVIGISMGPDDGSDIRSRIVKAFDRFVDIRTQTDDEAAALINEMQVDIAIDRTGYTAKARSGIFGRRPAPIAVNYIGFPGSLGADYYDYVLADPIVLPFSQQKFYTERIVHLPDCYLVNDATRVIAAETPSRFDAGLPETGFVFCCFNHVYKITPTMFDVWMRLLSQVAGSVLWLLRNERTAEDNLRREAEVRGIDPARLIFADRVKVENHLARHCLADLFLDTLPYNAHTTASEALWTGLPIVTCLGETFAGRVAASELCAIGLPDLVTHNLSDYEALALRLATEPTFLQAVKEGLRKNRLVYPLFDSRRYRRHIEAAYETMWEIWQRGERPRSFAVTTIS